MAKKTVRVQSATRKDVSLSSSQSSWGSGAVALLAILLGGSYRLGILDHIIAAATTTTTNNGGKSNHPYGQTRQAHFIADHGGLQVIEPFLRNSDGLESRILQQLQDFDLWDECVRQTKKSSLNFWLPYDDPNPDDSNNAQPPPTVWEELARYIWNHPAGRSFIDPNQVAGFEYWCNILGPSVKQDGQDEAPAALGWHQDRDEGHAFDSENPISIYPVMGSVFYGYPHDVVGGGELEFVPQHQQIGEDQDELTLDNVETEAIEAVYNRLVFLNVTHWHRVAPFTQGQRMTFAVNLWNQRPRGLLTYQERLEQQKLQGVTDTS